MELRQVETFRVVAEELSFSRAAARLGYVQSSVSAQVVALERELGVPLFDRLGRRIALTDAGEVMLVYARKVLSLAEETREAVVDAGVGSGEVTGSLTVSDPETLLTYRLPRLLAFFHERHPKVRLSVRPSAVGRLIGSARRALEEGAVDVAFVLDAPLEGRLEGTNLVSEPLVVEGVSVVAPPSHTLAHSPVVLPEDLSGETVLLPEAPEAGCAYRGQFERHLAEAGVVPRETMEFQSIEAVKRCVAAGMGVSVLPGVAVGSELEGGALATLGWEGIRGPDADGLAWRAVGVPCPEGVLGSRGRDLRYYLIGVIRVDPSVTLWNPPSGRSPRRPRPWPPGSRKTRGSGGGGT